MKVIFIFVLCLFFMFCNLCYGKDCDEMTAVEKSMSDCEKSMAARDAENKWRSREEAAAYFAQQEALQRSIQQRLYEQNKLQLLEEQQEQQEEEINRLRLENRARQVQRAFESQGEPQVLINGVPAIPAAGGVINPANGHFCTKGAGGYIDTTTGQFMPAH